MTRNQKNIITILSVTVCALALAVGVYAYQTYETYAQIPLGPELPVHAYTPIAMPPTWTPTVGTPMGMVTLVPTIPIPPINTIEPICHGPDVMNILAIGADSRQDAYTFGLADAIRIVRVEFKTPKITVLEFQRDLWVEIPYIADDLKGMDHAKLNQAYLFGQPGYRYWDDPSAGSGLLALTLNQNFGVRADNYITVNMRTFENIVNAVGGIDINITDDETAKNTGLTIGSHHLDGPGALKVARNREEGTFERGNNQNRVLCALRKKLTSPTVVGQIPGLIASFRDNIVTDLTPEQITQLACLGTKLRPQNIVFASFPENLFAPSRHTPDTLGHNPKGTFIWDVDFNILRDYVTQFQEGTWPETKLGAPVDPKGVICE